jgi:hypothetical protein
MSPFANAGLRIATHAIGDRAVTEVLDAYEYIYGGDPVATSKAGARIEHASLLSPQLIDRIATAGVTLCIQPSFATTDVQHVNRALPPTKARFAYPWRTLLGAGAQMITGSDHPIEALEPLVGLARLANGWSQRPGFQTNGRAPKWSRLNVVDAIRLMTDVSAGVTTVSTNLADASPEDIDDIEVLHCEPRPFH